MPVQVIGRKKALDHLKEELKKSANQTSNWNYILGHGSTGKTLVLQDVQAYARQMSVSDNSPPLCVLIDFQRSEILFVEGILDAIVSGLRSELQDDTAYFTKYDNALATLVKEQHDYLMPESHQLLLDNVYQAFQKGYYRLVEKYRVMLLFDTMEQFEKDYVLLDNAPIRQFFCDKILSLHGTSFVLAGRSHHTSETQPYEWHHEDGIRPQFHILPNQELESVDPQHIHHFVFSEFGLTDIRRSLSFHWQRTPQEYREDLINKKILPYISEGDELNETPLANILKNPLLLTLFAENFLRSPYVNNINKLPESHQDMEFILVQRYCELGGLSDVIMYTALKDYGLDEKDLANIMRIDKLVAYQKLKALRDRPFVKCNPNGNLTLHDGMRTLIEKHIWEAYDPFYEQRYAIYCILLDRYQDQLITAQKALAERIKVLQNEPNTSSYDILNHSLEFSKKISLTDLATIEASEEENWGYHLPPEQKAIMSTKEERHNRQLVQIWIEIQIYKKRKNVIAYEMRQMVNRLELCKYLGHYIRVFEIEWYLARNHRPNLLNDLTDEMIDKMQICQVWEQTNTQQSFIRNCNFRVAYLQGQNLEYEKRYQEAFVFYDKWLHQIAEREETEDIERRIYLLTRQAMVLLHQPDGSLDKASNILGEVLNLCRQYPAVAHTRSNVEAKVAFLYHLQSRFAESLEWYENSLQRLRTEKDGQLLRTNLMLNLVQSGYVQRYNNPRVGIELADIGCTFLVREGLETDSAMALRALSVLHRRNGDYEDSFRYALQSYKLAHQIDNGDIAALALIELAVTRWYAVVNVRGTDARQSYIAEPIISSQLNANMEWSLQYLGEAYQMLDGHFDDHVMNLEFLRLNHLMIRVYIDTQDEEQARHYLKRAKDFSANVNDFYRTQQLYADELLLEYSFDTALTYQGFINLNPYKQLMKYEKQLLSSNFVGNAHCLAGQVAQRMAILTNNDEFFDSAIEHYMQAYIALARQPHLGTLNLRQDWRLLEDRIRELELSELPPTRIYSVVLNWCDRLDKELNGYNLNWEVVRTSYPQLPALVKGIRIRQQLMTLQMKPVSPDENIYKQVDSYIARRQHVLAWRIIQKHKDDERMLLRKIEVLTSLERFIAAAEDFHKLQDVVDDIQWSEAEEQRFWIQQAVLWAYYNDPSAEESNLQITLATMLGILDKLDAQIAPDIAALANFRFGDILQHMGYYYPALHYFEEAMEHYVQLENPIAAADCLLRLSRLHSLIGNYELAIWYADQGTTFMNNLKHHEGIVDGYTALGIAYRAWAVYAGLRGAPGTLLQHYQQARHYLETATKQAELLDCRRLIPEILKELSLTLRYESNLVSHNDDAYKEILKDSERYLDDALRRYQNRPQRKHSPRQFAELHQLRGHVFRKLAARQINEDDEKRQELVEIAFEIFADALKFAKQSNDYIIIAGTYLTLIEMLYVNNWAEPKPTPYYNSLELQFQHETNLYQHFRQHDTRFADFLALGDEFNAIEDNLINRINQTLDADELFKIPDGLRHYFGRIEMIFANVALWSGSPEKTIDRCASAAKYFARSSRAVYNVKHMLRQIRYYLDNNTKMPTDTAERLYLHWENDKKIQEIYPDLLALCRAYRYIHTYIDVSYDKMQERFELDAY